MEKQGSESGRDFSRLAIFSKLKFSYYCMQFTFHSAMIRDALRELHQVGGVEIVNKVEFISSISLKLLTSAP
jgi:hypothetical protein